MSKIYEALLRAEMDRITRLNTEGHEAVEAPQPDPVPQPDSQTSVGKEVPDQGSSKAEGGELEAVGAPIFAEFKDWHPDEKRLPTLQSRGAAVEQFRVLRSRISEMRFERKIKTILISSSLPEEGKSFVAANLAIGLAKFRNKRVLLIDGDMRRGTLHDLLGTAKGPGLTEYLAGEAKLEDVMQRARQSDSHVLNVLSSLTFIPSGRDTENAADLSGNGVFQRLLDVCYEKFDWIIVDSSPVTLVSDGANLAQHCDGVLFVARGGSTRYEVAQRALHELKAAHVLGVVLNAAEVAAPVTGYYGYGE